MALALTVLEAPWAEVRARVGLARAESVGEVEDRRPGWGSAGRCRWAPNGGWAAAAGRPRYGLTRTASAPVRSESHAFVGRDPVRLAAIPAPTLSARRAGDPAACESMWGTDSNVASLTAGASGTNGVLTRTARD